MSHLFLSYSHTESTIARQIKREIETAQHKGWLDEDDIRIGGNWQSQIDAAISSSQAIIVLLSPNAYNSPYVTYEWSYALGAGKPVLPVLVRPSKKVHPRIRALQYLDFTGPDKPWGRLIDEILHLKEKSSRLSKNKTNAKTDPQFIAEFELEDGTPSIVDESYKIWIGIRKTPEGTDRVHYKIHDETFEENEFTVLSDRQNFMDSITSYGNILISASGKGKDGKWLAKSTLVEALRRYYRSRMSPKIRKAIINLENN